MEKCLQLTETDAKTKDGRIETMADHGIGFYEIDVTVEFFEELLGTSNNNPEVTAEYIASKAPDAPTRQEEIAAIGVVEYDEKGMTVFPRNDEGVPFVYDYQVKGFMKDSCQLLRRADAECARNSRKIKAFKKEIDGNIFVEPRQILLELPPRGFIGDCQRPLRAQTAQGERVALAHSETAPAGTRMKFKVLLMRKELIGCLLEWLEYGRYHGFGQWRNSGKGRFRYTAVMDDEVIGGNMGD